MTLKLEVGKKYVDSIGGVVEIIASHKHDDGKIKFWAYSFKILSQRKITMVEGDD